MADEENPKKQFAKADAEAEVVMGELCRTSGTGL